MDVLIDRIQAALWMYINGNEIGYDSVFMIDEVDVTECDIQVRSRMSWDNARGITTILCWLWLIFGMTDWPSWNVCKSDEEMWPRFWWWWPSNLVDCDTVRVCTGYEIRGVRLGMDPGVGIPLPSLADEKILFVRCEMVARSCIFIHCIPQQMHTHIMFEQWRMDWIWWEVFKTPWYLMFVHSGIFHSVYACVTLIVVHER